MASGSWDVPSAPPASSARNRPDNTAFTQQRLPAWQPLLSAGTVLPLFLGLGLAFLALGLGLHFSSEGIQELELDYTGTLGTPCAYCANRSLRATECTCTLRFQVPHALPAPTCFYYQLSGYYQNNRRYGVSRDDQQLSGSAWALRHPADECRPFRQLPNGTPVAPCGAVADSLFNDTFELHRLHPNGSRVSILLDQRGISWWTDTNLKFRNPQPINGSLALAFAGTAKPPNWPRPAYDLDPTDPNNTGFVNEHFVVWMRTAALPTFRKLYARLRPQDNSSVALPPGNYSLTVHYNYPVLSFHGTKKVILSTVSWMGGKNPFLGIAYLVLGSACILTGCLMLAVHLKYREQSEAGE